MDDIVSSKNAYADLKCPISEEISPSGVGVELLKKLNKNLI